MNELNPEENTVPARHTPFGVEPVDPLVFKKPTDSPELRPGASYVTVGPQLTARTPKPQTPLSQNYPDWTPGGLRMGTENTEPPTSEKGSATRKIVHILALLFAATVPLTIIAFIVYYASQTV